MNFMCIVRTVHILIIVLSFGATFPEAYTDDTEKDVELFFNKQDGQENSQNAKSTFPQRKWITQLFYEAEMAFQMDPNVNIECKKDFDLFNLHFQNQSLWAIKMMESSEWPLGDIFSGAVDYMGNYDECLTISSYGIEGQYCLTEVKYDFPDTLMKNKMDGIPDESHSVWEALIIYEKSPARLNRKNLRFALCIPSSCTPVDLKISLNSTLNPIFRTQGLDISVDVNPILCKTHNEITYPLGYYIVGCSFVVFCLFVILCTFCNTTTFNEVEMDREVIVCCVTGKSTNYTWDDVCKSCSIIRNFKQLIKYNPKFDQGVLHFIKWFNILSTIYGHRMFHVWSFPTSNAIVTEQIYVDSRTQLAFAYFGVDIFFMVSGFIKFHVEFLPMSEKGKVFLFFSVLFRWIRLVPVCGVAILFIIYVLPYIGNGPLWDYALTNEANNCKKSWWAVLLAVSNTVEANAMCPAVSWYIAVDIQLSIFGGILLYIYTKNKKIGTFAVVLSFVLFTIMTFIVCYVKEYNGITRLFINTVKQDIRNYEEMTNFFIATYPRCGPYLMGFWSAYIVKMMKDKNCKFTEIQTYLLFLISLLITGMSLFYGKRYYDLNAQIGRFGNALYAAVNHSSFVTLFALIVILYFTSGLGILQRFLNAKIWTPLGRLSYSVFLINIPLQLYHVASQKKPIHLPNLMNMYWYTFGDILLCYAVALILHLFIEAPISSLSKTLIQRKLFKSSNPNETIEDRDSNDVETKTTKCQKIQ